MVIEALKQKILSLAIRGKLVEQRPEEGTAEELYQQIRAEKESLIKAGRIKKEKPLAPITEDEIPFEIPKTWKWVRLGEVCSLARGGSPRPISKYLTSYADGVNWIRIGDAERNGKYISSTAEKITFDGVAKSRRVYAGDFLLTNSMSFGRPYILKTDGCIHQGWLVISQNSKVFIADYLYYLLTSRYSYAQFSKYAAGGVVKNLNSDKVSRAMVPLPPLMEQKRIAERIEILMQKLLEVERSVIKSSSVKIALKTRILQEAIQGKLVEQRPEEGSAEELYQQIRKEKAALIKAGKIKKEKPLPPITEDEIPFEIPDTWKWVRLGEIFAHNTGKAQNASAETKEGKLCKFITTSNLYWNTFDFRTVKEMKFTESEIERCSVQKGDLLVCEGGDCGRAAIWPYDERMCIQNHIHRLRPYKELSVKFFYYVIYFLKQTGQLTGHGVGIKGLSSNALHGILIPVPPLREQEQIVSRLENIEKDLMTFI